MEAKPPVVEVSSAQPQEQQESQQQHADSQRADVPLMPTASAVQIPPIEVCALTSLPGSAVTTHKQKSAVSHGQNTCIFVLTGQSALNLYTSASYFGKNMEKSIRGQSLLLFTHSAVSHSCNPLDCTPPGSSVHGIFQARNTGMGCHCLLQGDLPDPRIRPCLLHWHAVSSPPRHQRSQVGQLKAL